LRALIMVVQTDREGGAPMDRRMDEAAVARRLEAARAALLQTRRRVEEDALVDAIHHDADAATHVRELGEIAAEEVERELDHSLVDLVDVELAELDAAQERLAAGTYGRCEVCDGPIGDERLEAVPWARRCVVHQQHAEQARTGMEPWR
jgi:DnaK suppressor protein